LRFVLREGVAVEHQLAELFKAALEVGMNPIVTSEKQLLNMIGNLV
jgi:hypothetical protein